MRTPIHHHTRIALAQVMVLLVYCGVLLGRNAGAMTATEGGPLPEPLFPPDNWWNLDISTWPVDPGSASYVNFINNGSTRHLHPDFGGNAGTQQDPYACYGMPYAVVSGASSSDLL